MSAIALDHWESFVSRVFRRDLDSGAWFVEFFDPHANDNDADDEDLNDAESLAIFWQAMKFRR